MTGASSGEPRTDPAPSAPRTARERARAEITAEILRAGRRHLATEGAAALSLRAVARDLGMASSAVYRYVASREDLLTRLIIDAYNSLGDAVQAREARADRADLPGRWSAACHAIRDWALAHPNEYALIYGSPVPGYSAPRETIGPASRVASLLATMVTDSVGSAAAPGPDPGTWPASGPDEPMTSLGVSALEPVRATLPEPIPADRVQLALMTWAAVLGMVSLEIFGQLTNVVGEGEGEREAFFDGCVRRWGHQLGLR